MTALLLWLTFLALLFAVGALSNGVYFKVHWWRRPSITNAEPDLFHYVFGLGFCTLYICKRCLIDAYCKLRRTFAEVVADSETREGR